MFCVHNVQSVELRSVSVVVVVLSLTLPLLCSDLHLLRLKRKEQIDTVEKVLKVNDYSKQYKAITMLLEALFPVSLPHSTHHIHISCSEIIMCVFSIEQVPYSSFPHRRQFRSQ